MLNTRYGMIQEVECDLMDELLNNIKTEFGFLRFLEVGVSGGGTANGVLKRCQAIGLSYALSGVDLPVGAPQHVIPGYTFYEGDSMDMWRKVKGSFNLMFVDGCHCVNHSMCDFLNYSPMVEIGGYALFHDTALRDGATVQDEFLQPHSYAGSYASGVLGVRSGLEKMGLLQGYRTDWQILKEVPSSNGLFGMILFKKLKAITTLLEFNPASAAVTQLSPFLGEVLAKAGN